MNPITILTGDNRKLLSTLPDESVQCCVTSPPYWGLRDYGHADQIGQEATPEAFVQSLVEVFREVRRVLKADGTCWLNLGDTYNAYNGNRGNSASLSAATNDAVQKLPTGHGLTAKGLKPKDLVGIPWMVAFALRADGWYLRQDIIWAKPNPMPESVTDRCTKSHEYLFLLTKSANYFYDHEAIKERAVSDHDSGNGFAGQQGGAEHMPMSGGLGTKEQWRCGKREDAETDTLYDKKSTAGRLALLRQQSRENGAEYGDGTRNRRSVWTVPTLPYKEAHFATFPAALITPCILAGTKAGDVVLDPFGGSGTTGMVALELGRQAILIELNPDYSKLIEKRTTTTVGFGF